MQKSPGILQKGLLQISQWFSEGKISVPSESRYAYSSHTLTRILYKLEVYHPKAKLMKQEGQKVFEAGNRQIIWNGGLFNSHF